MIKAPRAKLIKVPGANLANLKKISTFENSGTWSELSSGSQGVYSRRHSRTQHMLPALTGWSRCPSTWTEECFVTHPCCPKRLVCIVNRKTIGPNRSHLMNRGCGVSIGNSESLFLTKSFTLGWTKWTLGWTIWILRWTKWTLRRTNWTNMNLLEDGFKELDDVD